MAVDKECVACGQVKIIEGIAPGDICDDCERNAELYLAGKAVVAMWDSPLYKLKMKPCIDRLRAALFAVAAQVETQTTTQASISHPSSK